MNFGIRLLPLLAEVRDILTEANVEESDGRFSLFEMKWNPKKSGRAFPSAFSAAYDVKESAVITPENYIDWL